MTPPWTPSGTWKARFRDALRSAYTPPALEMLTGDFFGPDTLTTVAPIGLGGFTVEYQVFQYIEHARSNGFLPDLVRVAHQRRPKDAELAAIAETLGLTSTGPRLQNGTGKSLEELIQANAQFINPAVFRERLPLLEGQVCKLEIPGGGGTGFLVARDLVLTNHHVVMRIKDGRANWSDVTCLFDFRQALDGTPIDSRRQTRVKLAGPGWFKAGLTHSQYDFYPQLGDATKTEGDCALITLAQPIGDDPVGGATADPGAPPRGWIALAAAANPVSAGNQLFMLQHPSGEPMQLTVGTVKQFNQAGTRVRYDANSKPGSSGAPCFNADLQLVALHQSHDPATPPAWNQGIPCSALKEFFQANGLA